MAYTLFQHLPSIRQHHKPNLDPGLIRRWHIDPFLTLSLLALIGLGLLVLYSASNGDSSIVVRQALRFAMALVVMVLVAQIPPHRMLSWAPWLYLVGVILLAVVLVTGHVGKGAQRWLDLGIFRFQPSEILKLAIPMFLAWYLHERILPPNFWQVLLCGIIIIVPVLLTAKQPDLGTAIMLAFSGAAVLFLAGIRWRLLIIAGLAAAAALPAVWYVMHDYQRKRVLTFINPETDPLGAGYHIIQSKIAIGSGGFFGKGWLNGTQSHLNFLPEHTTDFIFSVMGEELGFIGGVVLITLVLMIALRGLYMSMHAKDTFSRLVAGSLIFTFFFSIFVNIGMVSGLLPVVGVPLPLVSYGGTSLVTLMASFGVIMSLHSHRKLMQKK